MAGCGGVQGTLQGYILRAVLIYKFILYFVRIVTDNRGVIFQKG